MSIIINEETFLKEPITKNVDKEVPENDRSSKTSESLLDNRDLNAPRLASKSKCLFQ
ncbi:hypothetical protein [Aquimarina sp. RZ0]|uniref:hypothetical protein n=1 Tax=Aquimarina sp. RZ0 TaxID=2607730 RepID=UPI00165F4CBD|nr:hypothetical protein [Aquimarina sp. RZ0]